MTCVHFVCIVYYNRKIKIKINRTTNQLINTYAQAPHPGICFQLVFGRSSYQHFPQVYWAILFFPSALVSLIFAHFFSQIICHFLIAFVGIYYITNHVTGILIANILFLSIIIFSLFLRCILSIIEVKFSSILLYVFYFCYYFKNPSPFIILQDMLLILLKFTFYI